ncbi:hypothetical protein FGG78_22875, partial [Thioclava sp. BHET1]
MAGPEEREETALRAALMPHPLGPAVIHAAEAAGVSLADPAALAPVLAKLAATREPAITELLLVLASALETLVNHEQREAEHLPGSADSIDCKT